MKYSLAQLEEEAARRGLSDESIQKGSGGNSSNSIQGILSGLNTSGQRLAQGILQPLYESNLVSDKTRSNFANMVKRREQSFKHYENESPFGANLGLIGGDIIGQLPADVVGLGLANKLYKGAKAAKYAKPAIGLGIGGGLYGGAQHVGEGESRLSNIGMGSSIGAGFGAASPLIAPIGKRIYDLGADAATLAGSFLGHTPSVKKRMFEGVLPSEAREGIRNKKLAESLGVDISPAEATGSPFLAKKEARIGSTPKSEKRLTQYKKGQKELQGEAVQDLLNTISLSKSVPSSKFRETSQSIIDKKRKALQEKAEPFYKASESDEININKFNSILRDSNVEQAYKDVTTSSLYRSKLKGAAPNSVKVLDRVKRRLGDKISLALRKGKNDEAAILKEAQNKLVSELDKVSPKYKKARNIYSEDLPAIKKLEETEIGKIAKMKDMQLKKASKTIFDPQETDIKVIKGIKKEIEKEDPQVWADMVKHEMQRRITGKNLSKTGNHGSNFYDKILADDKTFNQFKASLSGNKEALKKLNDMRSLFRNIMNSQTVKSVAGKATSSLDVPRSTPEFWIKFANGLAGGRYDEAALNVITSNKWDRELQKILDKPKTAKQKSKLEKIFKEASKKSPVKSITVGSAVRTSGDNE